MAKRERQAVRTARTKRAARSTSRRPTRKAAAQAGTAAPPGTSGTPGASGRPEESGPAAEALGRFEAAMRAMQGHDYDQAARQFTDLLTEFPRERALLERVRVYLALCERELKARPTAPSTVEERLTLATAALNNDEDAQAERLATEVLAEEPDNDLALYLAAAVRARRGDADAALEMLRRALEVSPDVRAQARHDADFDLLKASPEFQALVELSTAAEEGKPQGSRLPRR
jgi:predicted Zn-dependent protease